MMYTDLLNAVEGNRVMLTAASDGEAFVGTVVGADRVRGWLAVRGFVSVMDYVEDENERPDFVTWVDIRAFESIDVHLRPGWSLRDWCKHVYRGVTRGAEDE